MAFNRDEMLAYFAEQFGVDTDEIKDDTLLFTDGHLDSFSIVDLVLYIESEAEITVEPSEVNLDNLDSVGRIISFVDAKAQ